MPDHSSSSSSLGVARGCNGCTCTPVAEKKIRRNLQGKFVSVPQAEQQSIVRFYDISLGWGDLGGRSGSFSSFSVRFEGDD